MRNVISIDFDNTISTFEEYKGDTIIKGTPISDCVDYINLLFKRYKIIINTTRAKTVAGKKAVEKWLKKYNIKYDLITNERVPYDLHIDDRTLSFKGQWNSEFYNEINSFKSWNEYLNSKKNNLFLILLIGNINTGKSSYVDYLFNDINKHSIDYDELFEESINNRLPYENFIFNPKSKYISLVNIDLYKIINGGKVESYLNKRYIYKQVENNIIENSLKSNVNVLIDKRNYTILKRKKYINIANKYGAKVIGIDFGSGTSKELNKLENDSDIRLFSDIKKNYQKPKLEEGFYEIYSRRK